jgi:hypothetical protein
MDPEDFIKNFKFANDDEEEKVEPLEEEKA